MPHSPRIHRCRPLPSQTQSNLRRLPLVDQLEHRHKDTICGLAIINIDTQEAWFTLEFVSPITELFDVQLLGVSAILPYSNAENGTEREIGNQTT
ncbi:MAG: hypothetical protein M2R45_00750 [Verrucomicrobia subdivision 3 bacterium]|nr:hypothetical protein [Limisphaerales bacterium]MCS1413143.1 hypothetical protein [Limisphaerales bacterium]